MHPHITVMGTVVMRREHGPYSCYAAQKNMTIKLRENKGIDVKFILDDGKTEVWFIWDAVKNQHEAFDIENLEKLWAGFGADWKDLLDGIPEFVVNKVK